MALYEDRTSISPEAKGIYRYLDVSGAPLYIGKGGIRDRLAARGRDDWGIHKIEYSIIANEEYSMKWMSHYISEYRSEYGELPSAKRIRGQELPLQLDSFEPG